MARSHHRKKHKGHVQQYKNSHNTNTSSAIKRGKAKATTLFAILGAVLGLAIAAFASKGIVWMLVGLVAGAGAGYLLGMRADREKV